MSVDLLPNCIAQRNEKTVTWGNGIKWLPTFCANCGKEGGLVMQTDWERVKNFAFYLCELCAEKWGSLSNCGLVPDELFWRKLHEAQLESFGRDLSEEEIVEALKDDGHVISKICKDRYEAKTITT